MASVRLKIFARAGNDPLLRLSAGRPGSAIRKVGAPNVAAKLRRSAEVLVW
jgi:hypothetical protein